MTRACTLFVVCWFKVYCYKMFIGLQCGNCILYFVTVIIWPSSLLGLAPDWQSTTGVERIAYNHVQCMNSLLACVLNSTPIEVVII